MESLDYGQEEECDDDCGIEAGEERINTMG